MQLRGSTRGRGANILTGRPGTQGSQTILAYNNKKTSDQLDYSKLISQYRKYFGLILANLYASPVTKSPEPPIAETPPKFTIIKRVKKYLKKKPRLSRELRLNEYNSGSKLSELLLQVNRTNPHEVLHPNYFIIHRKIAGGLNLP